MTGVVTSLDMTTSRPLPQPVRFGLVGVLNTALDWVVFGVGVQLFAGVAPYQIKAVSFVVGVASSYFFNSRWTFAEQRHPGRTGRNTELRVLGRFLVVSLLCLGINILSFQFVSQVLGLGKLAGLIVATVFAFVFGFGLNRAWTFRTTISE